MAWVTAAPTAASPSGTGGQYVPIAKANLVDRWQNVGYSGPIPANTVVTLQINGQVGLPSTGVAAVVFSVMTINTSGTPGTIYGNANTGTTTPSSQSMLLFSGTGADSNNAIVENGTNGKIDIWTNSSTQVRIDVQGYFTVGNGNAAPGGYVSGAADAGSTGTLALNQTSAGIKATGIGAVPITATAVFANLEVDATDSAPGPVGKLVAFPASTTPPATMLSYEIGQKTMIGTIIDLDAQGMLKIKITEGPSVSVRVNIIGYFDGQASNDAITPVHNRVYDTAAISSPIPAGQTRDVQVAGVQSVPANGCSMAAVDFHLETSGSSADGSITAWPSDESMPAAVTMLHTANSTQSNATILRVGCADGKIKVRNNSASGSVQLIVDAQNYFTNTDVVGPASGLSGWRSGSRADHQPISRTLNDRTALEVDPAVGNLLVTQSLLGITGVGPSVGINVRYNAENDFRPTLNLGLFESQLYRNSNNTLTYTDAKGTAFDFSPVGNGTYVVPKNINAHLTRTVSGSPDAAISAGATYELVFHPAQIKNVYVSDGANLRLTETRDITGNNKITYAYSGGRLTSLTDTQGRVVTFGYSNSPNPTQPTTITDTSLNRTITLVYAGPKGALTKVTDATGAQTTWAYNAGNKLASVTDGAGRKTEFTYSGAENKIATIKFGANDAAVAGTWTFAYVTTPSIQAQVTDPNNRMTVYEYDDTTKVVKKVTDARGNLTSSDFNPHGDLLKTTNAATNFTTYTVESASFTYNLTKVASPTGGTGGTGAAGRTGEAIYPSTIVGGGATVDYRPTSLKDSQGNLTNLQYNSWGQTAQEDRGWDAATSTAVAGSWSYKYQGGSRTTAATCGGKSGQVCSVTDGKGNVTSFAYKAAGNLSTMTPPAPLGASSYTYDAAGRRITVLDGKGVTTYTCYDANDRVTQVSTTSSACGTASGVRTTYDQSGNATTINNTTNSTVATVTWDAQSRPTNRTWTIGGTTQSNLASSATYYRAGNVLTAVDGGTGAANTTTYTYDAANNVITLAEPGGSCPATPAWPNTTGCTGFEYDANNQRIKTKFPNGVASTVAYDTSQRMSSVTLSGVSGVSPQPSWTWAYQSATATDAGLVSSVTDEAGNKFAYTYDKANRLLTAQRKNSGGTVTWNGSWTLDKNGNRTQQVVNGATTNYGYNAADQLCWYGNGTSATCTAPGGATSLTYDGNGNQTGGPTYTAFNQLATSGATTYSYGGTTQSQRLSHAGTPYTPSLISNQTTQHGTSSSPVKIIRDPSGALIGYQGGGGIYYYVTDRQGSVVLITGGTGNSAAVAADYDYAPYGATISATGGQATTNKYRYIGAFIDDTSTGLYKMGARYYNQDTGRFTQPDPSGQEANRYNYSNSNPATYSDPSGLQTYSVELGGCLLICLGVGVTRDDEGNRSLDFSLGVGTPGFGVDVTTGFGTTGTEGGAYVEGNLGPATVGAETSGGLYGGATLGSFSITGGYSMGLTGSLEF